MNTLEASVMLLPALWLAGAYGDPSWAVGFVITLLALSALLVQGGWGIATALLAA